MTDDEFQRHLKLAGPDVNKLSAKKPERLIAIQKLQDKYMLQV